MNRLAFLKLLLGTALAAAGPPSRAAEWPGRMITLVVPLAPGGSTDTIARVLAERLGRELGQRVVVDNRPGAGGNTGAAQVARAAPDGHTLLMATSTLATNVSLYKNMGFDPRTDLAPVAQVTLIPNVLVINNDVPAKSLQEFIDYARREKGAVNFGSAGTGTSSHLSGALFGSMAQIGMVHVPYKGGAPANADLVGGRLQAVFAPMIEVLSYIDGGTVRALGVTTRTRSPRLPDVPAIAETLPDFELLLWNGVFAPAGTPPAVVTRLSDAIREVLLDPDVRGSLEDQGATVVGSSPEEFGSLFSAEVERWGKLVRLAGATVE